MSYRSDDLTTLFAPDQSVIRPQLGYRQGIVREWNPDTAAGVIEVDGMLMSDLPMLNTTDALLLTPGDVVSILTLSNGGGAGTWGILGRYTSPGTLGTVTALSAIGTVTGEQLAQHSTTSTSYVDLTGGPSVTVNVRPSGRVLLIFSCQIGWQIAAPGAVSADAGIDITGANVSEPTGDRRVRAHLEAGGATSNVAVFGVGSQKMLTGLNPGETTFTMKYRSNFGQQVDFDNRVLTVVLL
ncbi:hypothetical protein DLJ47_17855 [Micromonospora sp. S4605]|uniref:hypothetical protein n=1 Tax=Micromonospora sp. S4605 TaxID=1420897 RepID=UPI000D6FB1B4|nr:hypothetical protein [Micromonospora sp. S4605]PWU52817.1 hypothetical protein DLJ47_17855 [Micromonospora sp. S4605]